MLKVMVGLPIQTLKLTGPTGRRTTNKTKTMTFNHLKELILEGAPCPETRKIARKAMNHYSYTSFSFRITYAFRQSRTTDKDAEQVVVGLSDLFYDSDLPRYERTGSFDSAAADCGGKSSDPDKAPQLKR
jgi:hypothetical protein